MLPDVIVQLFSMQQELLWLLTLCVDFGCTGLLYRYFGRVAHRRTGDCAAKYVPKLAIAATDTVFVCWAGALYRKGLAGSAATAA